MALRHQYQQTWTHCLCLTQAWLHVTGFGKTLFIVRRVRIALCGVYPENILVSPSLDLSLISGGIFQNNIFLPREVFLSPKHVARERGTLSMSQGFYFLPSFTRLASPGLARPPHSGSQERNLAGTHPTVVSLWQVWHASCVNLKRRSQILDSWCV